MKGLTGDHSPESRQLKLEPRGSPWAAQGHPQTAPHTTLLVPSHVCAKLLHSCLSLCDPVEDSPPGSSIHGILQARILEWVAMPFSRGSSRPRDRTHISYIFCIGSATWEAPPCTYTPRNDSWESSPPTTPAGPLTQGPDSERLSLLWLLGELVWPQSAARHPGFAETPADSKGAPSKDVWHR